LGVALPGAIVVEPLAIKLFPWPPAPAATAANPAVRTTFPQKFALIITEPFSYVKRDCRLLTQLATRHKLPVIRACDALRLSLGAYFSNYPEFHNRL
jgi:hypothetical protein